MTFEQYYTLAVLIIPLFLVGRGYVRPDLAALLSAFALAIAQYCGVGVLGPVEDETAPLRALTGLAQPVTLTLFSLFVVSRSLEVSGVARFFARRVVEMGRASEPNLIGLLALNSAFLSLFMNNLAAGSLVLPSAIEVSKRTNISPSKFLLPVAYGACLGGAATYFTTTNIIASDMLLAAHPRQSPLGILDFTPTGGLMLVVGILFLWSVGWKFLPAHQVSIEQQVARRTGTELEEVYGLNERQWEVAIPHGSLHAKRPLSAACIGERIGLTVLAIYRDEQIILGPSPHEILEENDRLLILGNQDKVNELTNAGFRLIADTNSRRLSTHGARFAEVVLIPQSRAEGQTLRQLNFRIKYGMSVVALKRDGQTYRTDLADIKLRQGDSLLTMGGDDRINILRSSSDFLLIDTDLSDQPTNWKKATLAISITLLAIISSILGVPVYLSTLGAAALILLCGILSMDQAYRGMEWPAVLLVAGMYPLSLALIHTGLAANAGEFVVSLIRPFGPLGLVAGAYIFTAALAQAISGPTTVLISTPIFISAAIHLNTNPQAIAVTTAIACSTWFLTPLSHPVVTLMMGPGNYRFGDFFRAGWILSVLSFLTLLIAMALFWKL